MLKLGHFSRYLLEILYINTPNRILSHTFLFWKFEDFDFFGGENICIDYFPFCKIFKILKIRDSSLIEAFILKFPLTINQFYLLSCLRDNVSPKPLFVPKIRKTWRHSDVIYSQFIRANELSFCQHVPNNGLEDTKNLAMIRLLLREISCKN